MEELLNNGPLWAFVAAALATLVTHINNRREQRRREAMEPVTVMTDAAVSLTGAMEHILGPLKQQLETVEHEVVGLRASNAALSAELATSRVQVSALRSEVSALRALLEMNGIDHRAIPSPSDT